LLDLLRADTVAADIENLGQRLVQRVDRLAGQ
jgi:hypothetical protein